MVRQVFSAAVAATQYESDEEHNMEEASCKYLDKFSNTTATILSVSPTGPGPWTQADP